MSVGDRIIWVAGACVLGSGAVAATLFLLWQALECAINVFKIKRLILAYYVDQFKKRQARVITRKQSVSSAKPDEH